MDYVKHIHQDDKPFISFLSAPNACIIKKRHLNDEFMIEKKETTRDLPKKVKILDTSVTNPFTYTIEKKSKESGTEHSFLMQSIIEKLLKSKLLANVWSLKSRANLETFNKE